VGRRRHGEDCPPGQARAVRGRLSFYEGSDVKTDKTELKRLKLVAFR
jgi:hypothetical protein